MNTQHYFVFEFQGTPDQRTRDLLTKHFGMRFSKLDELWRSRPGGAVLGGGLSLGLFRTGRPDIWRLDAHAPVQQPVLPHIVTTWRDRTLELLPLIATTWHELSAEKHWGDEIAPAQQEPMGQVADVVSSAPHALSAPAAGQLLGHKR